MEKKITPVEKGVLTVALLICAVQLGLIAYSAVQLGIEVPGCVTNVVPFTQGKLIPLGPNRYEVHVLARMWGFEPDVVRVPKGSTVDFYLTSMDITHGFYIGRTNVNLIALPNVVNYAQARFKETGKYPFLCHEYCGTGHQEMNGMIEVTEAGIPASAEGIR